MTRKKPDDTAPNGKGGELREIDDEWRAKTNAQRKRLGISIRELARRAGCSHAILVAALDPAKGKTVFSWYDACEEALRRAERGDESRVHAPRPQGAARDVSEDALPVGSGEERRNLLAALVRTMSQESVDEWFAYMTARDRKHHR